MIRCRAHPTARAIVLKPIDKDPHWMCMTCGKETGSITNDRASGVLPISSGERKKKSA